MMSKYVVFENNGVLDPRAIRTFGVSAKDTQNPIGFFGTGLKYAIAICLRQRIGLTINSGDQRYEFARKEIEVRSKPFTIFTMNNEELPFTDRLGINWELWQAFRELYCNCIDEGGRVYLADQPPEPEQDKTFVIVSGHDFELIYHERETIVLRLPESMRISEGEVEIFSKPSKALYYRGIRVYDLPKPAALTYNIIKSVDLTEDRTLKHVSYTLNFLPQAVARMTDKRLIRRLVTAPKEHYEHDLSFSSLQYGDDFVSQEFADVLAEEYSKNNSRLNHSAREYHRHREKKYQPHNLEPVELSVVEAKQLERAVYVCSQLYPDFREYKISVVKGLGNENMAIADMVEREIILSKKSFMMGTKYLVSTLIEEYVHVTTRYHDLTRELQTHLFDTIATMIEDHVIKEPI